MGFEASFHGVHTEMPDGTDGPLAARDFFDWLYKHAQVLRRYEERILGVARFWGEPAWARQRALRGGVAPKLLAHVAPDEVERSVKACDLGEWVIAHAGGAEEERLLRLRYLRCFDIDMTAEFLGQSHGTITNLQRKAYAQIDASGVLGGLELWPAPRVTKRGIVWGDRPALGE